MPTQLLSAGADKVSVNSAALARPSLITELAEKLGSQAVVVAIDTEGGRVRTRAGTTETARGTVEWAREAQERGAGEILLTSIDSDGTREGYDLEITRRRRRRGVDPGDRLAAAQAVRATSPTRSRSRRPRCSRRSCTRIPSGSRRCARSCATMGVTIRDAA